jgi:hypothetical protein
VYTIAAGIAVLAVFTWTQRSAPPAPEFVARIATLTGGASLREDRGEIIARVALPIHAGTTLSTSEGRLALTFGESLSLRIDRRTRLRLDSRHQVTLLEGALYVDSGGINAVPALRIQTPSGMVRHVATQFEVQVTGDTTRVRVREGRVLLERASDARDIAAGDELRCERRSAMAARAASFGASGVVGADRAATRNRKPRSRNSSRGRRANTVGRCSTATSPFNTARSTSGSTARSINWIVRPCWNAWHWSRA